MTAKKSRYILFLTSLVLLLSTSNILLAESYIVTNKSELENACAMALPGDSIILKDKAWTGVTMEFNCIGAEGDSITICSETPGGASLENGSRIIIGGKYLVISGLKFVNGYNVNSAIVFTSDESDAYHCRLTNCLIDGYNPPDLSEKYHWVIVYGGFNRIDHCRFSNMNHRGVTVMVKAGSGQPGHHRIDHNFFGPKPEGDGNGYETIKMGGGKYSMYPLYTIVERNFFYKCDGETELISNKSWENIYRHNTFFECRGTLTLRWGRKCLVEGNYFIGNGIDNTGGIRITDQDHTIINNYLENIMGKNAKAAISVMSGIPDTEGGNGGHGQTKNARILHNTIIGCKESLNMGYWDDDDLNDPRGEITAPENCTIANNIIVSEHGPLIKEDWEPAINSTWMGNMLYGAEQGIKLESGVIIADPGLVKSDGIMRITENSMAVNNAEGVFPEVLVDFELQPRDDGSPDIGADEWSDGERSPFPVGENDVGPDWYIASTNSNPVRIHGTSITIYPNPARDRFFIALEESMLYQPVRVDLIDLTGKVLIAKHFTPTQSAPEIITDGIEGHFIVRISGGNNIVYSRVILTR